MRKFTYPLIVGLIVVLTWISAMGQEPEGSIVISVRDVTTGYALPAFISISRVEEDGSTGPVIDAFQMPVDQEVAKRYPAGRYLIQIEMEGYQPVKSWFVVEAGRKIGGRYMLSPAQPAKPVEPKARPFQLKKPLIPPDTAVITGYVTDDETGQPLKGVHIRFDKTGVEVYTDQQGYFTASIPIKESILFGDQEVKALQEDIIFALPGYKILKEINVLLTAQRRLKKNVTMFKGEGEIIHDRTHPLLMPPERRHELQKYRSEEPSGGLTSQEYPLHLLEIMEGEVTSNLVQASTQQLQIMRPPERIKVGFSSTGGRCSPGGRCGGYPDCTTFTEYPLEDYVLRGVGDEWLPSWVDYPHSIRAGTVAYRSYGAKHVYYPDGHSGSFYDICSSPCCQTFDDPDEISLIKTAGIMLQKGGILFEAEYSAENNCLDSPYCANPDLSCGNCYVGSPAYGWPCLYDPVGCGQSCSGHGRGMSQWGTYRWAQQGKLWVWMVNHYYNANGGDDGSSSGYRTAYMTSPVEITSVSPTPSSVLPGQTFQIDINANNYAGLAHTQIIIGASLYSSSTGYINDPANDKKVTLNPGSNAVTRSFTVPPSTPSGTYDLIVALWLDVDENGSINGSVDLPLHSKTLSQAITVGSTQPDLVVSALSNPPATGSPGGSFPVNDTTANQGTGPAGASTTRFYLSTDATITTGDTPIGSRSVPSLAAGASSAGATTVTIPTTIPLGTYYLGACADADGVVAESNEANNCRASATTIIICPATVALEGAPQKAAKLGLLYDFRDQVLANTSTGQRYITLFYKHALEGVWLMVRHPELRVRTRVLLERFLPLIRAIVAGRPATMTPADLAAIDALLEAFAAKASPGLQADVKAIQEELRQGVVLEQFGIRIRGPKFTPRR